MQIQGAAISLAGNNLLIVLVDMGLVTDHAEANMTIETLSVKFNSAPIVLMAQKEDGSPVYYGDDNLVRSLQDVAVEQLPWKEYSVTV